MSSTPSRGRRIFLLTHPRTASNLLVRMLNLENQPSLNDGRSVEEANKYGYFFLPTMPNRLRLAFRPSTEWTAQERADVEDCFQGCVNTLVEHAELAEKQERNVFVKEHLNWMITPSAEDEMKRTGLNDQEHWESQIPEDGTLARNQTVFPDAFLLTWTPTFLIRHPALVFPSIYRTSLDLEGPEETRKAADGMFRSEMTVRWSRELWEWFHEQYRLKRTADQDRTDGSYPIILDADEIILFPYLVKKYCSLVGLDASKCLFEWPAASAEDQDAMNAVEKRMKSSLLSSTGIVKQGKTAEGLEIETEKKKWTLEFGEEEATKIERWVRDAMSDYGFLRERRLRLV